MMMGGKRKLEGGDGEGGGPNQVPVATPKDNDNSEAAIDTGHGGVVKVKTDDGGSATQSSDGRATAGGLLNPLLNEVVLRNLFKCMSSDVELVAECRLVCKTWRDASLQTWRSVATPWIFFTRGRRSRYVLIDSDEEETSLAGFLDLLETTPQAPPYRQFHLERWIFEEEDWAADIDPVTLRFWQLVGGRMTKLKIHCCNAANPEEFFRLIKQYCPNLEVLILDTSEFRKPADWKKKLEEEGDDVAQYKVPVHGVHPKLKSLHLIYDECAISSYLRVTYMELLSQFPNLTYVNLVAENLRKEIKEFLNVVKIIRMEDPRKLPITQLGTGTEEQPFDFRFLRVRDPPGHGPEANEIMEGPPPQPKRVDTIMILLQELGISLQNIYFNADLELNDIQTVIKSNGPTLTRLKAWVYYRCDFPFGVELPNLTELAMTEGCCNTFGFIKYTPNLKSLRIWDDSTGFLACHPDEGPIMTTLILSASKSELANVQLLKLTTLKLENLYVSEDDLRWLVKWMPRVKILAMILDDKQFSIVCGNWQDLIELHVEGKALTDEGVTGITSEEEMGAGVASLQKLEVFAAPSAEITDASIFHGLLKLPVLRRIFVCYRIGDRAQKALDEMGIPVRQFDVKDRF